MAWCPPPLFVYLSIPFGPKSAEGKLAQTSVWRNSSLHITDILISDRKVKRHMDPLNFRVVMHLLPLVIGF